MNLKVPTEQDIFQELFMLLEQNLELSKVVLLLSRWQSGKGDCLKLREELFRDETVDSLGEQILAFEAQRARQESA